MDFLDGVHKIRGIMIPIFRLDNVEGRTGVKALLGKLRLMPADVALGQGKEVAAVQEILADVARRGDAAVVDSSRKFDDPNFSADQIRVKPGEMADAAKRIPAELMSALRRSIAQVREYQQAFLPNDPPRLERAGVS
ncbi:MAG: hisD, partial [Phycisphaerales bacterium]|nr:hisD [Phycisphaerales bacterium]